MTTQHIAKLEHEELKRLVENHLRALLHQDLTILRLEINPTKTDPRGDVYGGDAIAYLQLKKQG